MPRRTDTVSAEKRSAIMRAVRSRGNKATELALVRLLRQRKITGWRRNRPIFGKPDFVFLRLRLALFVDGCFWHGCSKHCRMPKTNSDYWRLKIARNKRRDASDHSRASTCRLACGLGFGNTSLWHAMKRGSSTNSAGGGHRDQAGPERPEDHARTAAGRTGCRVPCERADDGAVRQAGRNQPADAGEVDLFGGPPTGGSRSAVCGDAAGISAMTNQDDLETNIGRPKPWQFPVDN